MKWYGLRGIDTLPRYEHEIFRYKGSLSKKNKLSPFVRRTYVNGNKFQSVSTCDLTIACDS